MNPLGLLQQIPPEIRKWMLAVYAVAVAVFGLLQLLGVDWDWDTINLVMMVVGGYLGVQSAANVKETPDG